MRANDHILAAGRGQALESNKLIRNTFTLLSMTLMFSAVTAGLSMVMHVGPGLALVADLVALGLLFFVLPRTANSGAGIGVVFAVTGLLGLGLGPMLTYYLAMPNGGQVVTMALGGTGVIFLGLSGYVMTTRKDFSFMGGFLAVGLIVVLVAMLANLFFAMPALSLALSAAVVLLMSGFILFDVSRIVNGGETNYIMATMALYLDILNLFTSLLHLLGAFNNND